MQLLTQQNANHFSGLIKWQLNVSRQNVKLTKKQIEKMTLYCVSIIFSVLPTLFIETVKGFFISFDSTRKFSFNQFLSS